MFKTGTVWSFETDRFTVELIVEIEEGYVYDGDDEDGETQAKLDSGEWVAFESEVRVTLDNDTIVGRDFLGGSVYAYDEMSDFWTDHRSADFMNRNCSLRRAIQPGTLVGHYFPDMVRTAIGEARRRVRGMQPLPTMREDA